MSRSSASLAILASGVLLFGAALIPPIGTNKHMSSQLLGGLILSHLAVLPLMAGRRKPTA